MRIAPEILDTADDVGREAALQIADAIAEAAAEGRTFVLGCPSGRSPIATYANLAALVAERDLDLSTVVVALMDEYVEAAGDGYRAIDPDLPHSCVGFGRREILGLLNAAATPGHRIPDAGLWHPDPAAPAGEYDRALAAAGGIDVFLLASGASDGHVALNPVGAAADTVTRVVPLGEDTRRDNLSTTSLWAGAPHYVAASPNLPVAEALLRTLDQLYHLNLSLKDLARAAQRFNNRVSNLVAADPDVTAYVHDLEQKLNSAEAGEVVDGEGFNPDLSGIHNIPRVGELPSAEEAILDVEAYLRRRREQNGTDDAE